MLEGAVPERGLLRAGDQNCGAGDARSGRRVRESQLERLQARRCLRLDAGQVIDDDPPPSGLSAAQFLLERAPAVDRRDVEVAGLAGDPGRPCVRCRAFLAARTTLPAVERRLHPPRHRKPSRWRRLFQHVPQVNVPEQAHSHSARTSRARGSQTPAGAGSAPIAPVLAGRHERRSER